MTRRLYFDTSAYLCILLGEKGHEALAEEAQGAELMASVLLVLEVNRNLVRLSREGTLSPADYRSCLDQFRADLELFETRDLTIDLCQSHWMPAASTPRSLDLGHLRTALWFNERERLTRFVTMDEAQRLAAQELGLPT